MDSLSVKALEACRHGHAEEIVKLLASGADVNFIGTDGLSFLQCAVVGQHIEVAEVLLNRGALLDFVNHRGETALSLACMSGDVSIVSYLINAGASLSINCIYPIRRALMSSHIDVLRVLIDAGADINAYPPQELPNFHLACRSCNVDIVRMMIYAGADVNSTNQFGESALCEVLRKKNGDAVANILLDAYASPFASDRNGMNCIQLACDNKCESGMPSLVPRFVAMGVDINNIDNNGETALMTACRCREVPMVLTLLQCGADTSICHGGRYALSCAVLHENPNVDIINALLENGAVINQADECGENVLIKLVKHPQLSWRGSGVPHIVKLVIERGIDIDDTQSGVSCLSYVLRDQHLTNIAGYLLDRGADVNVIDNVDGTCPLIAACCSGHAQRYVPRILSQTRREFIDKLDNVGYSALTHACQTGISENVTALLQAGASLQPEGAWTTPLIVAAKAGHLNIVRHLIRVGADEGSTALHAAFAHAKKDIIDELYKCGGDVRALNKNGEWAISLWKREAKRDQCVPNVTPSLTGDELKWSPNDIKIGNDVLNSTACKTFASGALPCPADSISSAIRPVYTALVKDLSTSYTKATFEMNEVPRVDQHMSTLKLHEQPVVALIECVPYDAFSLSKNNAVIPASMIDSRRVAVKVACMANIDALQRELSFLKEVHEREGEVDNIVRCMWPSVVRGDCFEMKFHSSDKSLACNFCGIVMEEGERSVKDILGKPSMNKSFRLHALILSEALAALAHLQKLRIVHMDVKPRNIMSFGQRYKLIDFDASLRIGDDLGDALRWTTRYAAPELVKYKFGKISCIRASHKMDMWSFGMLMIEVRLGRDFWSLKEMYTEKEIEQGLIQLTQDMIDTFLDAHFGKEAAFRSSIGAALQIDPMNRLSASALLKKAYFTGEDSTQLHKRARINDELVAIVRNIEQKVDANSETLFNILSGRSYIPSLFIIIPVDRSGLLDKLRLYDKYRLYFVCPVTLIPARSGEDGEGYCIRANKDWVRKVAPAVTFCFSVFKVLLAVAGLPFAGDVRAMGDMLEGVKCSKELVKLSEKCFDKNVSKLNRSIHWSNLQENSAESYHEIYAMIQSIESPPRPVPPIWTPRHTGLVQVECRHDGSVNWVHEEVVEDYKKQGKILLKRHESLYNVEDFENTCC